MTNKHSKYSELEELIPRSGKLTDLQRELVIEYSNPEWWKSKFQNGKPITSEYDDADWWRFNADELTMTLEEAYTLINKEKAKAELVGRIDELERMYKRRKDNKITSKSWAYVNDRLAQLASEGE